MHSNVNLRIDTELDDSSQNEFITVNNEHVPESKSYHEQLADLSTDIDQKDNIGARENDARLGNQKKLTYKQRRRIAKCRNRIAQFNVDIEAMNLCFTVLLKKFKAGYVTREHAVKNAEIIDSVIKSTEKKRNNVQIELAWLTMVL